jgi:hypothetical protein
MAVIEAVDASRAAYAETLSDVDPSRGPRQYNPRASRYHPPTEVWVGHEGERSLRCRDPACRSMQPMNGSLASHSGPFFTT